MAAVMRLVNRSTLSSAMGQQYLAFSSAAKVKATGFYCTFIPQQQVVLCAVRLKAGQLTVSVLCG